MNFSSLSIKYPIPAILLFALLTLAGLMAFRASGVQDFPDIELPIVTVVASLPGAAPAQLETEVARKIEDSVASLQGVKNIYARILDGIAYITVEFVLEKNGAEAVNDVRDAVARVRADLPAEQRTAALLDLALDYEKAGLLEHAERILDDLSAKSAGSKRQQLQTLKLLLEIHVQERNWQKAISVAQRMQAGRRR